MTTQIRLFFADLSGATRSGCTYRVYDLTKMSLRTAELMCWIHAKSSLAGR
jgi:hypothetical protein